MQINVCLGHQRFSALSCMIDWRSQWNLVVPMAATICMRRPPNLLGFGSGVMGRMSTSLNSPSGLSVVLLPRNDFFHSGIYLDRFGLSCVRSSKMNITVSLARLNSFCHRSVATKMLVFMVLLTWVQRRFNFKIQDDTTSVVGFREIRSCQPPEPPS
jgi:hypothetical protein